MRALLEPVVAVLVEQLVAGRQRLGGLEPAVPKATAGAGGGILAAAAGTIVIGFAVLFATPHLLQIHQARVAVGQHAQTGKDAFHSTAFVVRRAAFKVRARVARGPKVLRQQDAFHGSLLQLPLQGGLSRVFEQGNHHVRDIEVVARVRAPCPCRRPSPRPEWRIPPDRGRMEQC